MKKAIFCFVIFFMCQISLMAQSVSVADSILLANALMQNKLGQHKEALEGFLIVGQHVNKQRTEEERKVYVSSQTMAAHCYQALKQYENAFQISEELLKGKVTDEETNELHHIWVFNGYMVALKYCKKATGKYADARSILNQILPFAKDDMRQHIVHIIPLTWYLEGTNYYMQLNFQQAIYCMEKAREGYHEVENIEKEVETLYQIGNLEKHLYQIKAAMEAYQKAAALCAETKQDSKYMAILKVMYLLSEQMGDYEGTLSISATMDSIANCTDDNDVRFEYYCHLGDLAKGQGNYELAEQWYRKNEQYINSSDEDSNNAYKQLFYHKLYTLFTKSEKWEHALRYAMLAKTEHQKGKAKNDKEYYMPYLDLSNVYRHIDDSIRCFQTIDTLFISLNLLEEPREASLLYRTRALCYSKFKNFEQALADFKRADSLLATKYDEYDGDRINLLSLMGGIEHQLGHHEETKQLYQKYADRIKKLYGEEHTDYIEALGYLANAEGFAGNLQEACNDYARAASKLRQQIQNKLPYMTTAERESYWKSVSEMMLHMTPFALEAKQYQSDFTKSCYDGLVLSKAFLLASEQSTFDIIKNKGTKKDLHDFTIIAAMQLQIKEWEKEGNLYADSILELTSTIKQLETRLSDKCRSYGNIASFMSIDYNKIKDQLNEGNVLIDFTDFVSKKNGRTYAAYFIDKKQKNPLLTKLFTESQIDSMQVAYPDQYYQSPYAETMYKLLWVPFKDKVIEGSTVYYVPSQFLFKIALESLPMEDGTLLGEHYHFVRLSSARELVTIDSKLKIDLASANTNAVLYGGLLYDLNANDWEAEVKKYDVASLLAVRGNKLRGDSIFEALPGTKKEVETIEGILSSHKISVKAYTGKIGTEESFLNMNGKSPRILHVATHGFFYTPDEAQEIDYLKGYEDAMSLSGLVMSGGNAAWLGKELPKGVLGGILTASNIARLDLSNTDLAVLSACQSGNGEATEEGLYGLQRALKKAGVKTIILSLWDVTDVIGPEFMDIFYENLLDKDNHWDKRKAFDKAKSAMRIKYSKPFYWAGFVMLD